MALLCLIEFNEKEEKQRYMALLFSLLLIIYITKVILLYCYLPKGYRGYLPKGYRATYIGI